MADSIIRYVDKLPIPGKPSTNPLEIVIEVVGYLRTVQVETTKRAQISARRDVLVHALDTEREIILNYCTQRFAERKAALDELFLLLRTGSADKDTISIDRALGGILGILQDNPLEELAAFKQHMSRPDTMLEF